MPDRALKIAILGDSSSAGIGDGKAIHAKLFGTLHQRRDPAQAIEKAIFGMDVEMGEGCNG